MQADSLPAEQPGNSLTGSVQFSSVAQSCATLCDPMNRSTPGLPVHHHLPEFTQTQVHRVSDAIQPSHLLSSHSPPAPNSSQHVKGILTSKSLPNKSLQRLATLTNYNIINIKQASLIAQLIKNLPAMQETLVQFLGWEDPLEKG